MEALISLFIVPTLSGYLFLTKTELQNIRISYYPITRVAVESLIIGIIFLYISYFIFGTYRLWPVDLCFFESIITFIKNIWISISLELKEIWAWVFHPLITEIQYQNGSADSSVHPISNQSISTVGIAIAFIIWEHIYKRVWSTSHEIKIAKEREKVGGQLESLLNYASDTQEPVQITMSCGKVYVGLVKTLPPINPNSDHHNFLRIIPLFSGYRTKDSHEVVFTTDYAEPIRQILKKDEPSSDEQNEISEALFGGINIDLNDVIVASIWSRKIYEAFKKTLKA